MATEASSSAKPDNTSATKEGSPQPSASTDVKSTPSRFSLDAVSQRTLIAATVPTIGVITSLLQRGLLGASAPFKYQLFLFLLSITLLPCIKKSERQSGGPSGPSIRKLLLFLLWLLAIGAPVFYALLMELFTGHQRPGSEWYHAVWRVYAIVALWIVIAAANERVIKPAWNRYHFLVFGERLNNVTSKAQELAEKERDAKLAGIKARADVFIRRRDRLQRRVDKLKNERIMAEQEEQEESEDAESKKRELKDINVQIADEQEQLDDVVDQLKILQHEWTEALHIENYRKFYK